MSLAGPEAGYLTQLENSQFMIVDRKWLLLPVTLLAALGICGRQAVAQDDQGQVQARIITLGHITALAEPQSGPGFYQGIVAMGPPPPVSGDWPCWAGSPQCSSVPLGGLVIGMPEQVWSKTCKSCGQIYWTLQSTTAANSAIATVTVTQGSPATTIYSFTEPLGMIGANTISAILIGPVSFTNAVAGTATINVSVAIGATTVKGSAKIVLH